MLMACGDAQWTSRMKRRPRNGVLRPRVPRVKAGLRVAILTLCLALGATIADAHDTWLLPSSLRTAVGRRVDLSLTSGMAFPADDFAIKPARIARASVRLGGHTSTLASPSSARLALRYRWTPKVPGVATIAVALAPKALTLRGPLIKEYLNEIDASPELRGQWTEPADAPWREVYTKHAKTFVRVDHRSGSYPGRPDLQMTEGHDSSWATPAGLGLEIVPEHDPTMLVAGDSLPVRVLYQGAPLPGFAVGIEREHAPGEKARMAFARTDAGGHALLPLPEAGRMLLKGTQLRRVHEADVDWRSDFTTLTISVHPVGPAKP